MDSRSTGRGLHSLGVIIDGSLIDVVLLQLLQMM
jgi:hypothetical protein